MEILVEKIPEHAQAFCDMCLAAAIRDYGDRPCFLSVKDDGDDHLILIINDGEHVKKYRLSREQQKQILEASIDLETFEIKD